MIISELTLERENGLVWTALVWLRIETSVRAHENTVMNLRVA
jgi:hypothetical protein